MNSKFNAESIVNPHFLDKYFSSAIEISHVLPNEKVHLLIDKNKEFYTILRKRKCPFQRSSFGVFFYRPNMAVNHFFLH